MRRGQNFSLWDDAFGGGDFGYPRVSYIIYRADQEDATILTARCPEMERFPLGRCLIEALDLDEEAQAYVGGTRVEPPLVVMTSVGVGILDHRYQRDAGIGVYWHVHGDPVVTALLIQNGAFGSLDEGRYRVSRGIEAVKGRIKPWDVPLYEQLAGLWRIIGHTSGQDLGARLGCDGNGMVYVAELARVMERAAAFVGCRLIREETDVPVQRVRCHRPALLEAMLLCLLTEVAAYGHGSAGVYALGALSGQEGEGLSLALRYPLEDSRDRAAELDFFHRYLDWAGDLGGLELRWSMSPHKRGDRQNRGFPEVSITLEWLRDPAVLSTTDLKAKPLWRVE